MSANNNLPDISAELNEIARTSGSTQRSNDQAAAQNDTHEALRMALELTSSDTLAAQPNEPVVDPVDEVSVTQPHKGPTGFLSWWTLKNKATLLAVALGTIPVLIVGGISTSIAGKQLSKEAIEQQQQFTNAIALQLQDFGAQQTGEGSSETSSGSLSERILNYTEINNLSDLVNQRISGLRQGMDSEDGSARFNVIDERRNVVLIANEQADIGSSIDALFPVYKELRDSDTAATKKDISTEDNKPYLITYTPVTNISGLDNDLGVLVYQPMSEAFAAQQSLVLTLLGGTILTALLVSTLAAYLANRATRPIIAASKAVEKLGQGKFNTRLNVQGNDELAILNSNINVMAEQLEYQLEFIQETAQRQNLFQVQATIAEQHQQKVEALQRGLTRLVRSVGGVFEGDLTVRAGIDDGEIGQLANLFNSVLEHLHQVVVQTRQSTEQIDAEISTQQGALKQLSNQAIAQTQTISKTIADVEKMSTGRAKIATSAQQAGEISARASAIARKSNSSIKETAHSISGLSATVTENTNKVKQLSAASQQISQVISLINEIALKTNLLAINASIETDSAQHNDAMQTLSSKIGQLSEQTTRATGEIERIVQSIQLSSKEIVSSMDMSNAQIVEGTSKLNRTAEDLAGIVTASTEIHQLTHSIAEKTIAQTATSREVANTMTQVKAASRQTATVSEKTHAALTQSAAAAQALAEKVETFRVDA